MCTYWLTGELSNRAARNWHWSWKKAATRRWESRRKPRWWASDDGGGGTDRQLAGAVHPAGTGGAVAAASARQRLRPFQRTGVSDYARRRVAIHQRVADCARELRGSGPRPARQRAGRQPARD